MSATMDRKRALLRFVRHGETSANRDGLRCGGDLDLPLTERGEHQAEVVAECVARLDPPVSLIVTSDLRRTRATAAAIARRLPAARVIVEPAFAERHLGSWNLLPIRASQPWLDSRQTPPGGESHEQFEERITRALEALKDQLPHHPLLVASKGVARVLGEVTGHDERLEAVNGTVLEFDLAARACLATTGSPS
jgi:broad specificity phosphatase PhoE